MVTGIEGCHVRTKSRSVDMELETKPDDYSLEIGDGGELKTIIPAKITGNLSERISHQQQSMILYSDGKEGRLSAWASGFAHGFKKFAHGFGRLK